MPDDVVWWLRLAALNDTARHRNRLLERFGSPQAAFTAGPAAWRQAGLNEGQQQRLRETASLEVEPDLRLIDELGVELVPRGDIRYPPLLEMIDDPPAVLFVRGRLPDAKLPCVALVGTRRTSPYGELVAEEIGRDLAAAGVGVISGVAAGIDAAAQRGALRGDGYTAGVLGCGVDVVYPRDNAALTAEVIERGGVISEFPLGTRPIAWHFPLRNRIISGLSRAVVVVQAPLGSGALITASLATDQNRDVMAVPGSITDGRQAGCHALIRDGAILIRGAADILEALKLEPAGEVQETRVDAPPVELSEMEQKVAGTLGLSPASIDDVIEQTGLTTPEVQSALVTLELKRVVQRLPGNRFVRAT